MHTLKIEKFGDKLVIALTPELAEKLNLHEGDELEVQQTAIGVQLTYREPNFETMKAYRMISEKYKNALRDLAQ